MSDFKWPINDPNHLLMWMALILPQIEQEALWTNALQALRTSPFPWDNPPHAAYGTVIPVYVCPSDPRLLQPNRAPDGTWAGYTSYLGVGGGQDWDGVVGMPGIGIRFADIVDGSSNTLMVGERPPPDTFQAGQRYLGVLNGLPPGAPRQGPNKGFPVVGFTIPFDPCTGPFRFGPGRTDNPCDRFHFWSLHPRGSNFLFADGAARFLAYSAEPLMVPLATRAGGEVVELPD